MGEELSLHRIHMLCTPRAWLRALVRGSATNQPTTRGGGGGSGHLWLKRISAESGHMQGEKIAWKPTEHPLR